MRAGPFPVYGLQLSLHGEDKHFDVGQGVPAVTTAGTGDRSGRRGRRLAVFRRLVRSIGLRWSAQAAGTIYVSEPTQSPLAISRTDFEPRQTTTFGHSATGSGIIQ
jgi:hypothetical protein